MRFSQDDRHPVSCVSWNDAQEYIRWMNRRGNNRYRLPTEAEWEYAARSGRRKEKWAGTSSESELGEYAWYVSNSEKHTHPVGQKRPNGLGLYDMTGNAWEWVQDCFDEKYYGSSPKDNPGGPSLGSLRVFRGGSWMTAAADSRGSRRGGGRPFVGFTNSGFRLARTK
jgi:formylglycine-generating enzyme required for sulfatase activity